MSDGFYYRFIGIKLGDPKQMDEDGSLIGNTIWAGQGDEDLNDKDIKELMRIAKRLFRNDDIVVCEAYYVENKKSKYISTLLESGESLKGSSFQFPIKVKRVIKNLMIYLGEHNVR